MRDDANAPVTFREALRVWARVGLLSFGGPAGQIATMHRILVEEKRWIGEARFLHALNFCMLLPGPEATQLATYVGWLLHGTRGGVAAGVLFVLPGFFVILALSTLYAMGSDLALVQTLFYGLKAAVFAVVVEALLRIGKRALKGRVHVALAALAFVAIFALGLPFPLIVLLAGLIGLAGVRVWPGVFAPASGNGAEADDRLAVGTMAPGDSRGLGRSLHVVAVWCALWVAPVLALAAVFGSGSIYPDIGIVFSQAAMVTFGGAYAVLAYIAQAAVGTLGWLRPGEMVDGLALAETTPGPLILVLTFVGYLAAFRDPGGVAPLLGGFIGAGLTTWVTFVPCFLWIFLGAPYIEALRHSRALAGALTAITAAVVGVILNLTVWFGLHVVFREVGEVAGIPWPVWGTVDGWALLLSAGAMVAVLRFHVGIVWTLAGCAAAAVVVRMVL
ncbi:chromate efflux transporter [Azospirillum sp.]|uniref:chromate efflux transporter n=1 Tax=Azospirillum sp. TaxID=34012 RepID=UPI003D761941